MEEQTQAEVVENVNPDQAIKKGKQEESDDENQPDKHFVPDDVKSEEQHLQEVAATIRNDNNENNNAAVAFDALAALDEKKKKIFHTFKENILSIGTEKQQPQQQQQQQQPHQQLVSLNDEERRWLDDMCLLRYLRARDWDLTKSEKMLHDSLLWRRQHKPQLIQQQDVQKVMDVGGMFRRGFDKSGNPIIYMKPGENNPYSPDERARFLIWLMEDTIKSMDTSRGVEKITWILDFSEYSKRTKSPEAKQVSKNSLHILQNEYPERLGHCFFVNAPWYMSALYKVISPFINSNTRKKLHWLSGDKQTLRKQLSVYIEPHQFLDKYGGDDNFRLGPQVEVESGKGTQPEQAKSMDDLD